MPKLVKGADLKSAGCNDLTCSSHVPGTNKLHPTVLDSAYGIVQGTNNLVQTLGNTGVYLDERSWN